jgi:hypothetical protein
MNAIEAAWVILKKSQEEWNNWSWDNACDNCHMGYQEAYKKPDGSYGNPEADDGEWTEEVCSDCNGTGYKAPLPSQYQQFHDEERN